MTIRVSVTNEGEDSVVTLRVISDPGVDEGQFTETVLAYRERASIELSAGQRLEVSE